MPNPLSAAAKGSMMFGDMDLNFAEDKHLRIKAEGVPNWNKKDDGNAAFEVEFDDGNVGLKIRLSKEQVATLGALLDIQEMGDYKKKLLIDKLAKSIPALAKAKKA